jgi:hypothetical protein
MSSGIEYCWIWVILRIQTLTTTLISAVFSWKYHRKIVHIPSSDSLSIDALLHYDRRGVLGHQKCMGDEETFRKGRLSIQHKKTTIMMTLLLLLLLLLLYLWFLLFLFKVPFLGAFAKLRKATIVVVMSISPSVRLFAWNNLAPTGRIFMKIDIGVFFENVSKKISSFH